MDANTKFARTALPEVFLTPGAPAPFITEDFHYTKGMQYIRLRLSNLKITVTAANDYGSFALCTFPETNFIVVAAEANLTLVKGNTATGIVAATGLDVSLGMAAASNNALTGTMVNILPVVEADAGTVTDVVQANSLATTPVLLGVLEASTNQLFLNVAPDGAITVDDSVTFSGTVDIFILNVENASS